MFRNPKSPSFTNDVRMKLAAIQYELDQGYLAVSCPYFSVTSGFLGQMFGLIVTYGIIIFQMRPNSTSPSQVSG
ncbi:unnamed protein product [Orchesella dallaii]|uniref:Uncharacterized protein n=1 Tax=Orchesella dallaii TaxID=48710 RepID=A0ABP1PT08_9HEXA